MRDQVAWPFLIGRARDEDYRFVVIPEIMTDSRLAVALRAGTGGEPDEPGTALVREIPVRADRPYTVVYQVRRARAEDYRVPGTGLLTDASGRPILLTEGLVVRAPATAVMEAGISRVALEQAHDLVTSPFQLFWAEGSDFTRHVGGPFSLSPSSSVKTRLRLHLAEPAAAPASEGLDTVPAVPSSRRTRAKALYVLGAVVLVLLVVAGAALLTEHIVSAR